MITACSNNKSVAAYIGKDFSNNNWKFNIIHNIFTESVQDDNLMIVNRKPLRLAWKPTCKFRNDVSEVSDATDKVNLSVNSTSGKDSTEIENIEKKLTSDTSNTSGIKCKHCGFETRRRFDYGYHIANEHGYKWEDIKFD